MIEVKRSATLSVGKDLKHGGLLYTISEHINWFNCFAKCSVVIKANPNTDS